MDKKWAGLIAAIIVIVAVWRFPFDSMREGYELMFRCGVIILFGAFIARRVNRWIGLFLVLAVVSHLFPFYTRRSYVALINIVMGCMFFTILALTIGRTGCEKLMDALCIIAIANVLFLVLQTFDIDPVFKTISGGRDTPAGLMANPNEASALMAMCLPAFFRGRWRWLLPLVIVGLFMARTTGGVLAAGCGLMVYGATQGFLLYSVVVAVAGSALFIAFIDSPSILSRWETWNIGWNCIQQHWLLGSGIGHWKEVFRTNLIHGYWFKYAHNEYLQGLFEMGIAFPLIVAGYLADTVRRGWRVRKEIALPGMALMIIAVNSMFNFLFHIAVLAMIALAWMAILEIQLSESSKEAL